MAATYYFSHEQLSDTSGDPIVGAKLKSYAEGTTTPLATYSNEGLTSANANPAGTGTTGNQISDANGRFGDVFLQALGYKFVITDSSDVTIWEQDNYNPDGGTNPVFYLDDLGDAGLGVAADDQAAWVTATAAGTHIRLKGNKTYYQTTGLTPADGFGITMETGAKLVFVTGASGSGDTAFTNFSGLNANRNAVAGVAFMLTGAGNDHEFNNCWFEGDNSNQPILRPIFAQGNNIVIRNMKVRNLNAVTGAVSLNEMLYHFIDGLDVLGNADMVDAAYTDITNYSPNALLYDDVGTNRTARGFVSNVTVKDLNRDPTGGDPRESDGITLGGIGKTVAAGGIPGIMFNNITIENVGEGIDCFHSDCLFVNVKIKDASQFGIKFIHGAARNRVSNLIVDGAYFAGVQFNASDDVSLSNDCENNVVLGGIIENIGTDPLGIAAFDTEGAPIRFGLASPTVTSQCHRNIVQNVTFIGHASSSFSVRSNLDANSYDITDNANINRIINCPNLGAAEATEYSLNGDLGTDQFAVEVDAQSTTDEGASGAAGIPVKIASETERGMIEQATAAEVVTGTDALRAVTPAGASAHYAPLIDPGFVNGFTVTDSINDIVTVYRQDETFASDGDLNKVILIEQHRLKDAADADKVFVERIIRADGVRAAGTHAGKETTRIYGGAATSRDYITTYDGYTMPSGSVLAFDGGSAALPGLALTGDLDTGVYSTGADILGVATAGTARHLYALNGDQTFYQDDGTTAMLFMDASTGAVYVGGTSGQAHFEVQQPVAGSRIARFSSPNNTGAPYMDMLPISNAIFFRMDSGSAFRFEADDGSGARYVGTGSVHEFWDGFTKKIMSFDNTTGDKTFWEDDGSTVMAFMDASSGFTGFGQGSAAVRVDVAGDIGISGAVVIDAAAGVHLPSYTAANIADVGHAVNTANKGAGLMVYDTTNTKMKIATGSGTTATWVDADGTNAVTPA